MLCIIIELLKINYCNAYMQIMMLQPSAMLHSCVSENRPEMLGALVLFSFNSSKPHIYTKFTIKVVYHTDCKAEEWKFMISYTEMKILLTIN